MDKLTDQPAFKAGSISHKVSQWSKLTSDEHILDIVEGFTLDFLDYPLQQTLPGQILKGPAEISIAEDLLQQLHEKGVIENTELDRTGFVSNIFLRPKRSGGHRLILNLKQLNEYVEYNHFKMDHLASALSLVSPNCVMASIDLADAYYSVNVHVHHRKYLQFAFQGHWYRFTCLANGISSAPRIFTKLMKVPLSFLREKHGLLITAYLDDLLLIANSAKELTQAVKLTLELLRDLGFHISTKKSVLTPSRIITFLGFSIDSITMTVSLPSEKVDAILAAIQACQTSSEISIRQFAALVGKLTASLPGNRYGQVFLKQLEIAKTRSLCRNNFNFDALIKLDLLVKEELQWWYDNLAKGYRPIFVHKPDLVLFTDASFQGWGCFVPKHNIRTGGRWTVEEQEHDINYLELKAVLLALKACCRTINSSHILIQSDNTTTVIGINRQGSTHSVPCNSVSREIWFWAMNGNNWLSATHCPGVLNIEADHASRTFNDNLEWMLDQTIFDQICKHFAKPSIDLFASRLNNQLDKYCAWQPDPNAIAIDSFTIDWSQFSCCYAFAPFSIIARTLQKLQAECVTAIVIVPHWPTQPWFGKLLQLMTRAPFKIPVNRKTLKLPHNPTAVHPLAGRLTLWACYITTTSIWGSTKK